MDQTIGSLYVALLASSSASHFCAPTLLLFALGSVRSGPKINMGNSTAKDRTLRCAVPDPCERTLTQSPTEYNKTKRAISDHSREY
jgi:hypothetical protein